MVMQLGKVKVGKSVSFVNNLFFVFGWDTGECTVVELLHRIHHLMVAYCTKVPWRIHNANSSHTHTTPSLLSRWLCWG